MPVAGFLGQRPGFDPRTVSLDICGGQSKAEPRYSPSFSESFRQWYMLIYRQPHHEGLAE